MSLYIDEAEFLLSQDDLTPETIDRLQILVGNLNKVAAEGDPAVSDQVYDRLKTLLEDHAPGSPILNQLWDDIGEVPEDISDDGLDVHLGNHPMQSIRTVKDWDDPTYVNFCSAVTEGYQEFGDLALHLSQKIDGHGIRVVYKDGQYVKATSRARSTRGRDLTQQMSYVVPESLPDCTEGIVEIRGEVCLRTSLLEEARKFTPGLKTAFSAVSSLIKPSSTPEENQLLSFLAYRIFSTDTDIPDSRTAEYELIESLGFETPDYATLSWSAYPDEEINFYSDIIDLFNEFCEISEDAYFLDGMVLEIDSSEHRSAVSHGDIYTDGALALKTGDYAQGTYVGYIQRIDWKPGRVKFSPVAAVSSDPYGTDMGVLTDHGNRVTNIPLYEPINILHLEAYIGSPLHFKYGGEAGVVPCFPDGSLLSDDAVAATNLIELDD